MNGLGNIEREGNPFDSRENENPMKDLVKECVFSKENARKVNIAGIGREEGRGAVYGPGKRVVKNERKLCSCKKTLQLGLIEENPDEMLHRLEDIKKEYCNSFALALTDEIKKKLPPSRHNGKNRTLLDEETGGNMAFDAFQRAEKSFDELSKGMRREIEVYRILNAISGLKAEIANSDLDVGNKIDIIAFSSEDGKLDKIVIAVQIKGMHLHDSGEPVEEVTVGAKDAKKKEFYDKSNDFEAELRRKDPEVRVIKIWINISDNDIINEGAGYRDALRIDIEFKLREILKKYQA